ncbi:phytanoyl-CoA dioxygenase family protein [Undibacterium sp. TJN19]|uniref:phytanoyl-CoA dioxygenase family protein n=1 Tax=Undibacterium sp. TJN19 TaxID=3413055 RepID=UPI003BF2AAD4
MEQDFPPTKNLDKAKSDLDTHGFCLIDGALAAADIETAKSRLIEQALAEQERGLAFRDGGRNQDHLDKKGLFKATAFDEKDGGVNQRLFMLINKGKIFRDLVIHPLIDTLVGHVLGDDFLLSTLSANIVRSGSTRMGLHTDQWWMPQPSSANPQHRRVSAITRHPAPEFIAPDKNLGIAPPVTVTAVWMLTDFTQKNGATEMVPGTHLSGAYPEKENQERYQTIQPEAPAGTLIVFDGRLWHGNGANIGAPDRIGVLATFCAPQFRQQENIMLGLDKSLWQEMPDKLKARLGFKVWNGYGRVETEFSGYVSPDTRSFGLLKPESSPATLMENE